MNAMIKCRSYIYIYKVMFYHLRSQQMMGEPYIFFVFETHGEKQNGKVAGEMGKVYYSKWNVANLL